MLLYSWQDQFPVKGCEGLIVCELIPIEHSTKKWRRRRSYDWKGRTTNTDARLTNRELLRQTHTQCQDACDKKKKKIIRAVELARLLKDNRMEIYARLRVLFILVLICTKCRSIRIRIKRTRTSNSKYGSSFNNLVNLTGTNEVDLHQSGGYSWYL